MTRRQMLQVPQTAPFRADEIRALNSVLGGADTRQRSWLSGFLAGCQLGDEGAAVPAAAPRIPLSILYATESGNAESVAAALEKRAKGSGFAVQLRDAAETDPDDLREIPNLLLVASTWGEGDPPSRAEAFYRALLASDAPRLDGTRFGVLGLGDSSYVQFCEVARRLDERFDALGGERILDLLACDLDFEEPAARWGAEALEKIAKLNEAQTAALIDTDVRRVPRVESPFSKARPFEAEIIHVARLSSRRSTKETLHVELSLARSGLIFEPGDAIGIHAQNDPALVEEILHAVGLSGSATLEDRLLREFDITVLTRPVATAYAALRESEELSQLLCSDRFDTYRSERQIVDLIRDFPRTLSEEELLGLFRKLPPRLYSAASSLRAEPDSVHLLLGVVRYEALGHARSGVATGWVADRREPGDALPIYVKPNRYFRLPDDPEHPIVMIGPGTGVAPFRAFLQERRAIGASGRNWLFFGERNFTHDFLYQLEWQELLAEGVLHKLDVAFSRDQREKVYVQHRLWEKRAEVFRWLQEGAHFYVCGDERAMAKDVDATMKKILVEEGGHTSDMAQTILSDLRKDGRYQRDLY
ncbi:MAG: sulfite reductase subunit alpha [Myxococcales bacterium]|nr:sulfite reductase subunit alpha [Myxococcales bacterium]